MITIVYIQRTWYIKTLKNSKILLDSFLYKCILLKHFTLKQIGRSSEQKTILFIYLQSIILVIKNFLIIIHVSTCLLRHF